MFRFTTLAILMFVYLVTYGILYFMAPYYYDGTDTQRKDDENFVPYQDRGMGYYNHFLMSFMQGLYVDFNAYYFADVGYLVQSMYIFVVFMPLIELAFWSLLRYIRRAYDQGKWCCPRMLPSKTKTKTINAYRLLY